MIAIKAHQAPKFLASPSPGLKAYLFYGTDAGLVSERARELADRLSRQQKPEGEVVRLDDTDVEADPERFAIELLTVPMFGGGKIVRTRHGRRINAALLKTLVNYEHLTGVLIVEAGNLRPADALRTLFEKAKTAAAVACYPDSPQDLEHLVNRMLAPTKQTIAPDAREHLVRQLGADRALSMGELEKLVLYTSGRQQITLEDVEAIVGDGSELALDKIVGAAALGNADAAVSECARAIASGDSPQTIIGTVQRHFDRLHKVRTLIESGTSIDDALRKLRPQVHFRQLDSFRNQVLRWTNDHLLNAIQTTADAAKSARLAGPLERVHAERLLIRIAQLARTTMRNKASRI